MIMRILFFFFSSRRRHTRCYRDWSSDVCSSDLPVRPSGLPALSDGARDRLRGEEPGDGQDRKSTRLNSSHGSISYAVFCLKKKKNTDEHSLSQKKKKTTKTN